MKKTIDVIWFKRELRVEDNILLTKAEFPVLCIFIFDINQLKELPKDTKRITFLFKKVIELKEKLKKLNLDLAIFFSEPLDVFDYISSKLHIRKIFSSIEYDNYSKKINEKISSSYELTLLNENFLIEPKEILNSNKTPYQIFSHFEKAIKELIPILAKPTYIAKNLSKADFEYNKIIKLKNNLEFLPLKLESLGFKEQKLKFLAANLSPYELLKRFSKMIETYEQKRDYPALNWSSLLSVHLRYGTISTRELVRWALKQRNSQKFISELIWREFFNYLLYHFPYSEFENFKKVNIKWTNDEKLFERWKEAQTGYPIVDAAMTQLKQEGYIHNRTRMVVANFLTKNLHIDWRLGEKYFSFQLLDYDIPLNVGNWQWNASVGVDPKFRFFNPFLQSKKFDPEAKYIKKYLPQLKDTNPEILHSEELLKNTNIKNYPKPIVDFKQSIAKFKQYYLKLNSN